MEELGAFARAVGALRPWLGQVVVVGGWAHRLHRFHPLANPPAYQPLRTRDADLAFSLDAPPSDVPLTRAADVLVPNPVSFIVQRLLIHGERDPRKKAQDVLYIHDTFELFGGSLEALRAVWADAVRSAMPAKTAKRANKIARDLFAEVTDTIREASRIPQDRHPLPEDIRAACHMGLDAVLGPW